MALDLPISKEGKGKYPQPFGEMVGLSPGLQPIDPQEVIKDGYNYLLKGVIVGPPQAGKTSLLQRFTSAEFNTEYVQTIGVDFAAKSFRSREGDVLKIQLWDTAGNERFRTITNSYYRGSHGVLMVFDVGDKSTFAKMIEYLHEAEMYTPEGTPKVLVGNKADVVDDRQVSREDAEAFAQEHGLRYIESTAKENESVSLVFEVLIEEMLKTQKEQRSNVKENPTTKKLEKKLKQAENDDDLYQHQLVATVSTLRPMSMSFLSLQKSKSKTCTIL